jgi:hypothetical protein
LCGRRTVTRPTAWLRWPFETSGDRNTQRATSVTIKYLTSCAGLSRLARIATATLDGFGHARTRLRRPSQASEDRNLAEHEPRLIA